ncbi:SusC/RagA family TonB-linked outer membrane protein [Niabella sp.]|uniref:SusC/RagA family TonB-linked outer membrane protein n=1 Tax=Niabella sp. TaxID=1962976 RepID=UPI00261DDC23|nr:SusC/RagA family TonB-linked outer membrane protein [Niabella sp.]
MKLTVFLLFIACMEVGASGYSQTVTFSGQEQNLRKLFTAIEQQTGYTVLYKKQVIDRAGPVTLDVRNMPLTEVLNKAFYNQPVQYVIENNTVFVTARPQKTVPAAVIGIPVAAEIKNPVVNNIDIQGVVKSEDGTAIPNASITVKGSRVGTTANDEGVFHLSNIAIGAVLEISASGFKSIEHKVTSASFTITLEKQVKDMDEVLIQTGYQKVDRKLFTGAATKLNSKDVERNGVPDISRMLEGQAAGVSVQNVSGTFGAAPKIRVRGATSLTGDNKPLWVVDGIILEDVVNISNEALSTGDANTLIGSAVAGLNPDDVESFNILKDAAATALYGARAMNGVIVVTTKKGRNTQGKANISYTGNFTTYIKPSYNQFDIMNSAQQMGVMVEMENKGYLTPAGLGAPQNGGVFYKLYKEMYDYDSISGTWALKNGYDMADKNRFLQRYASANTDWFDVLFKNSLLQEHSVSVSSGSERVQNYFSTSFMNDNGQTIADKVSRFTANMRTNFKISKKLSFEFIGTSSIRDQRTPGVINRESDPVYGKYSRDFDINPYSYALNTSRLITPYDDKGNLDYMLMNWAPFNILNEVKNNYLKLSMLDIKVQGGFKYMIIPGLQYSIDGAYRYAQTTRQQYILDNSNMAQSFRAYSNSSVIGNNRWLYDDPDNDNLPVIVLPEGGFLNTVEDKIKNYYFRQNVEFDKKWARNTFNFFGSMELRSTDRQNYAYDGAGYQYNNGGLVNPNYLYFKKVMESGTPYFGMYYTYDRFLAYMGRAAYNFDNRFSLNGTLRYDGSNKMGQSPQARWLPTWNLSGAWDISNEKFFPTHLFLSSARVRGTYGLVGNIGNATNTDAVFYNRISYRPNTDEKEAVIYIGDLANDQLTWEKMRELDLGADLGFFDDRLSLTVDYYRRNVFDLITTVKNAGIGGEKTKTANNGRMKGQGFETTIGAQIIQAKEQGDFGWSTRLNFAFNKNEIVEQQISPNIWSLVRAEGGPLQGYPQRGLFSIKYAGLDPANGSPRYINESGDVDNYIYLQGNTTKYLKYEGPVDPTFTGGYFNKLDYKGFSLSALFTFSYGNKVRLQPIFSDRYTDLLAMSQEMGNRWIMPGDENKTNIPSILDALQRVNYKRLTTGTSVSPAYAYNAYNYSDQRVAKGDFIRLKTVALAYLLPRSITQQMGLNSMQLSFVGNNIVLLYSDKKLLGADPEFFNNGGVAMPIPRAYTFSIKIGL